MPALPKPPALVLFDLDGTLVDTAPDFLHIVGELRAGRGEPPVDAALFRTSVSNGARGMIRAAWNLDDSAPGFAPLLDALLARYRQINGDHACLFPGMDGVLGSLDAGGIPWGVVTNKAREFTAPLLEKLRLRAHTVVCPDDVEQRKPHPESLLRAAAECRCRPEHSVYVGDHGRDIEAGRRAGMATVGVRFGYIPPGVRPEDWNADALVDTAAELAGLLGLRQPTRL